ncbi:MAG: 23S rRNA (adenine(2503)-C(2))-methyltransferase RlmN [Candidatus Omnitrophica bacterium]|nr:23S rRNA (adenine(2503)-C(2))-methyltransferase RlmN [Candidatus Omnitrophota bacterium]
MNLIELEKFLKGQPSFRARQVKAAIFKNLIESWDEASPLPKDLRESLKKNFSLEITGAVMESKDKKTIKAAIKLEDGEIIESVLLKHNDGRNTVCLSSQVGCPLGCRFCLTGKMGFIRNLEFFEILIPLLFFARHLKKSEEKITNIVFMGMGEPLLNYDEVIDAIRTINDENGFNIGARKISISTVGIIEGIKKLAREKMQINLAISLHAPNDSLRSQIIPFNQSHPLKNLLKTVSYYIEKTNRRVMIEYLMIKGINDKPELAFELVNLLKDSLGKLFFVNLIKYNATGDYQPSDQKDIENFKRILEKNGVPVVERYRFGENIKAACGQLAGDCRRVRFRDEN